MVRHRAAPNKRTLMFWLIDSNKLTPQPTKANPRPKPVPDSDAVWEQRIASVKAHRANVPSLSRALCSLSACALGRCAACLLACLPACLPACLVSFCLPTCLPLPPPPPLLLSLPLLLLWFHKPRCVRLRALNLDR